MSAKARIRRPARCARDRRAQTNAREKPQHQQFPSVELNAAASVNAPNSSPPPIIILLRPNLSPKLLSSVAPSIYPNNPNPKTGPKYALFTCHAFMIAGAAKGTTCMSYPSMNMMAHAHAITTSWNDAELTALDQAGYIDCSARFRHVPFSMNFSPSVGYSSAPAAVSGP